MSDKDYVDTTMDGLSFLMFITVLWPFWLLGWSIQKIRGER